MKVSVVLLCLSVATNVGALTVAFQSKSGVQDHEVLTVRKLKIVDENGDLCALLDGDHQRGGALSLYYPRMDDEGNPNKRFIYLGSPFEGVASLVLMDSRGGPYGASLSVNDQSPVIVKGLTARGSVSLSAGRKKAEDPVLRFAGEDDEVIFER